MLFYQCVFWGGSPVDENGVQVMLSAIKSKQLYIKNVQGCQIMLAKVCSTT